ncbi:MAG TPA: alpha/beta hydrolase [Candidatus Dormibacteraeota bacterium]
MRHKTADLDGPLHYLDFGGTGKPLVMVHGLGGNALNWMSVGPEVAKDYHAFALDLAGFGQTPLFDRSAAVGANAGLVHSFIEKVIGEPVLLMGNSMGGHIAILEAADHPSWVTAMVLVDPAIPSVHVYQRHDSLVLGLIAAVSIPGLGQNLLEWRVRELGPERLVQETLALVCADPSRIAPEVMDAHIRLTREREQLGRQNGRAFLQASRSISLRMADPRFWSRAAKVQAPTLVIHGSLDRLIPLAAAQELARRMTATLEILEGVGHVPMMEAPDEFMCALNAWSPYRIAELAIS